MNKVAPASSLPPRVPRWFVAVLGCAAVLCGLLLPWLVGAGNSPAASLPAPDGAPPVEAPDLQGMLSRLYIAVLVVLAVVALGLYACRRWLARANRAGGGQLAVLGAVRVGSRARVFLVQAPGQRLLAGVDSTGVKMLVAVPPARGTVEPA